jgi:dTDP-4-dehydrorhamnose 3,5-epimerase
MRYEPTPVEGCQIIRPDPFEDPRGFFARVWDRDEAEAHGMVAEIAQINLSGSLRAGTVRGLHWQVGPFDGAKVVRCVAGAAFDVCLDMRHGSSTFGRWFAIELTPSDRAAIYVPPGCAHGYQTLLDGTEMLYSSSSVYDAACERGVRWDDPAFGIEWPITDGVSLSDKDRSWPDVTG